MEDDELVNYINIVKNRLWQSNDSRHEEKEFERRLRILLESASKKDLLDLFVFLFDSFIFYTKENVNQYLIELYNLLNQELDTKNCLFTYIKRKDGAINSSIDYTFEFRKLNKISTQYFTDNVEALTSYWDDIENIVIIDDCCGTGHTLQDFINDLAQRLDLSNKTFYYLVIHQMQESCIVFDSLASSYSNLNIICLAINKTEKIFNSEIITNFKDEFKSFSLEKGIKEELIFGYAETEAIFAFYNNTPNNTLGIFHAFSKGKNEPLFPRITKNQDQPKWKQAKQEKKRRNNMLANKSFKKE